MKKQPGGLVVPAGSKVGISVYIGLGDTPVCCLKHNELLSKGLISSPQWAFAFHLQGLSGKVDNSRSCT